jgi:Tol biopolymer transport system component
MPSVDATGGDVWVMPALGGTPKRIVENGNFPAWSPDGKSLVFVRGPWSNQRLYRVPASGGAAQEIPTKFGRRPLFLANPRFSPDGKWIAFGTEQPNKICVVPASGGTPAMVADGGHPAWTADSRGIVYSDLTPGRNATLSLIRIGEDGKVVGTIAPITSGRGEDRMPSLSPDGRTVIFASQSIAFNVERIAFDGEAGKTFGAPESITRGGDFCPFFSVSPDGRSVVFQSQRGLRQTLWRQEIDTGGLTQLAADDKAGYSLPEWSPDGKQIAFTSTESGRPGEAWVMSNDGANPQRVAVGGFVTWLPDSRSLAYADFEHRDVRVIDLATRRVQVVANEGTVRTLHKFSADGKWMVYQAMGPSGLTEVRVVGAGSTKSRVLVRSAHENMHPFFSRDLRWVYFQPNHKNVYRIPGPAQGWKAAEPQQVTFFPESDLYLESPQLSADEKYLYYSRRAATSDLWMGKFSDSQ